VCGDILVPYISKRDKQGNLRPVKDNMGYVNAHGETYPTIMLRWAIA